MNKKLIKKIVFIAVAVVAVAVVTLIVVKVIQNNNKKNVYDNESDALVFSTLEVDKVFNPFFSTSATDSSVVGMTQIGMLGNDEFGKVVYGDDEAVVTKDLQIVTVGEKDIDQITTYYFVLKNNVRFSNGSYLTIKDVLFNLYVYLDPVYSGSSTIYSTDIVGLQEYRTQASDDDETEQENFKVRFENEATSRIQSLVYADMDINSKNDYTNVKTYREALVNYLESLKDTSAYESNQYIVKDFDKAIELFRKELETDYSNSMNSYEDTVFTDDKGNVHKGLFTTDVEVFLYNEGYIKWDKKAAELTNSFGSMEEAKQYTKEQAIDFVFNAMMPAKISEVVTYWMTSTELFNFIVFEAMENYYQGDVVREYQNISGIKFANKDNPVTVNGVEYGVPQYDENGVIKQDSYEVLSIAIHDIDPKAIWNFSFAVAPMYYYSDEEHINAFDFESNFGVEYSSQTFMNEVVKNPAKIGVPVGAGAYAASKASGGIENITAADFYDLGVIYFERNPYFIMGEAKIKKLRFQVVSSAQMLNALYNGEVDFVEPNAKPETIAELDGKKENGIGNTSIQTSGYGYIGINAGKVPSIYVRQAIMHSINTQECVDYYQTTAEAIYRPMSKSSWAYPENCTPYYPYIGGVIPENLDLVNPNYVDFIESIGKTSGQKLTEEEQHAFLRYLIVELGGYEEGSDGIYYKGKDKLNYTFTIAGQETDHPAWRAMNHAMEILNKVGFNVKVVTAADALSKLSSGALTVWAAAWGSTIDPDMYQVYHKDSNATSTLNWGYKQILNPNSTMYEYEKDLIEDLSDLIDQARETNDQTRRAELYSQALDIVMQLAVELPTYQRDDLYAYNTDKIDTSTFTPEAELSPYKGLTGDIHKVSLVTEK